MQQVSADDQTGGGYRFQIWRRTMISPGESALSPNLKSINPTPQRVRLFTPSDFLSRVGVAMAKDETGSTKQARREDELIDLALASASPETAGPAQPVVSVTSSTPAPSGSIV